MTINLTQSGSINRIESGNSYTTGSVADLRFTSIDGTSSYMTITTAGNVGIGTTSPIQRLDVSGALRVTSGGLMATFNSNTVGSIITTGGNVGIGTSSPESKLHINGSITLEGETISYGSGTDSGSRTQTYITFKPNGADSDWAYLRQIGGNNNYLMALDIHDDGDEPGFCIRSVKSTDNPDTINERFRVQANGNVGIGTSSPSANLHILGQANDSGSMIRVDCGTGTGQATLRLIAGSGSTNRASRIDFFNNVTSTSVPRWSLMNDYDQNGTNDFRIVGPGDSVRFTLNTAGNIGIGTSSPNAKLTLLSGTSGSNGGTSRISIGGDASHYSAIDGTHTSSGSTNLKFLTCLNVFTNSGNPLERMRIDPNGDIIHVSDSKVQFRANTGDGDARVNINDLSGTAVSFYNGSTKVGSITLTGSATAYNTSSDYRLKENVVDLTGAISRLIQIPVHRFNFINDPGVIYDGFLAHEVQAIVPEAVTGEKDAVDEDDNIKAQGIDQSKLVPLLTAALQELNEKFEELKQEFDDYKQSHP